MSDTGITLIKHNEGFRPGVYLDANDFETIGYGTLYRRGMPMHITELQAVQYLRDDVRKAESEVNAKVKVPLNQKQFDALVDFVYNLGNSHFEKSTLLRLVNAGDFDHDKVRAAFDMWDMAAKKHLPGLLKRRNEEADLFNA